MYNLVEHKTLHTMKLAQLMWLPKKKKKH